MKLLKHTTLIMLLTLALLFALASKLITYIALVIEGDEEDVLHIP